MTISVMPISVMAGRDYISDDYTTCLLRSPSSVIDYISDDYISDDIPHVCYEAHLSVGLVGANPVKEQGGGEGEPRVTAAISLLSWWGHAH